MVPKIFKGVPLRYQECLKDVDVYSWTVKIVVPFGSVRDVQGTVEMAGVAEEVPEGSVTCRSSTTLSDLVNRSSYMPRAAAAIPRPVRQLLTLSITSSTSSLPLFVTAPLLISIPAFRVVYSVNEPRFLLQGLFWKFRSKQSNYEQRF